MLLLNLQDKSGYSEGSGYDSDSGSEYDSDKSSGDDSGYSGEDSSRVYLSAVTAQNKNVRPTGLRVMVSHCA
jgi:hypothetical protein